ncbi:MAG: oxygenase MpaB family protein [Haloechinothrix sp.]
MAGAANVIMQLARLPVGHGVVESVVDSGNLYKHPVKRTRTTLAYLITAIDGTPEERLLLREQINRVHAQVRSRESSPVAYNAFDTDLQLWVAACLYRGVEDTHTSLYGELDPATAEALYQDGKRLGTTLQVTEDVWPSDRAAFEAYWTKAVELIEIDNTTRQYLRGIAALTFLPRPVSLLLGPLNRFLTTGFLPAPFREQMRLAWTTRHQRRFDALVRVIAAINRRMPRRLREFPFNLVLWDTRRRMRTGRSVI